MKREILVNATPRETRVAILEDGQLVELLVDRPDARRMVGDVYLGKVEAVLPGIQAAFVNIGTEKSAFLHAADVVVEDAPVADDEDDDEDEAGDDAGGGSAGDAVGAANGGAPVSEGGEASGGACLGRNKSADGRATGTPPAPAAVRVSRVRSRAANSDPSASGPPAGCSAPPNPRARRRR
jgi:Ribonuclease G/E